MGEDVEVLKFNTAVSAMMEFVNAWSLSEAGLDKKDYAEFLKVFSLFAPHVAEELWLATGLKGMCCEQKWPKYDEKLLKDERVMLIVQVNGKVRDRVEVAFDSTQKQAEKAVFGSEKAKNFINESEIKKTIYIPNKLINFVV